MGEIIVNEWEPARVVGWYVREQFQNECPTRKYLHRPEEKRGVDGGLAGAGRVA